MSKIKVEKFVAGTLKNRFAVSAFAVTLLTQLLPASAISELAGRGIDLLAIIRAKNWGSSYSSSVAVTEDGVQKMVIISVYNSP